MSTSRAATEKFYNYYENGLQFVETGDYLRALAEFQSAASLEFEDTKRKRTYGTRFIAYHPHYQLGLCYYHLGEPEQAVKELELHKAWQRKSKLADELLNRIAAGDVPQAQPAKPALVIEDTSTPSVDEELPVALEVEQGQSSSSFSAIDVVQDPTTLQTTIIPATGAAQEPTLLPEAIGVSYSPESMMQVGSRLSIAVLPFEVIGTVPLSAEHLAEALASELVNLRRFRVVERNALDRIMEEQALSMSGMVDQSEAIELAKLVGADALVMGRIASSRGETSISARVIDSETGVALAAHKVTLKKGSLRNIDRELGRLAVAVYNDLPLLGGSVVSTAEGEVYLDIGGVSGVRRGFKLVVFREGKPILHPATGEELGVRVTQLGEVVVTQVQDQMAITKPIGKPEQPIKNGDQVITK